MCVGGGGGCMCLWCARACVRACVCFVFRERERERGGVFYASLRKFHCFCLFVLILSEWKVTDRGMESDFFFCASFWKSRPNLKRRVLSFWSAFSHLKRGWYTFMWRQVCQYSVARLHAYFKYTENFATKIWKFSDKNSDILHISAQKHRLWVLVRTASARRF